MEANRSVPVDPGDHFVSCLLPGETIKAKAAVGVRESARMSAPVWVSSFFSREVRHYGCRQYKLLGSALVGRLRWPSETRLENAAFRVKIYNGFNDLAHDRGGIFIFDSEASCPRATWLEGRSLLPAGNFS